MTIIEAIASGKYDKALRAMDRAIRERREAIAWEFIRVGAAVRFPRGTRPSYLSGMTGKIKEVRRTRVLVMLDHPEDLPGRKFRGGVVSHPSSLEAIPQEVSNGN